MKKILSLLSFAFFLASCGPSMTFEEQIVNDIQIKVPSGICKSIPKGTVISNIKVGEIVDIGMDGMTDVTYEYDYEINGETQHTKSALLYIKQGSSYTLAAMGGDCDFMIK